MISEENVEALDLQTSFGSDSCDDDVVEIEPFDEYDYIKAKIASSLSWVLNKAYGGRVPSEFKDPFIEQNGVYHIKNNLAQLLSSGEVYCRACTHIFPNSSVKWTDHQSVISALSRRGIYVMDSDEATITGTILSHMAPFRLNSHLVLIDCLMKAYTWEVVTIDRVVHAVKKFSTFLASQELPMDTESALVFWINKVTQTVLDRFNSHDRSTEQVIQGQTTQRVRIARKNVVEKPRPNIPVVQDVSRDLSDGCCLCILISFYCPDFLKLCDICLKPNIGIADSLFNIRLCKNFCRKYLPTKCFHFTYEDLLYSRANLQQNIVTFLSELFVAFELGGMDDLRTPRTSVDHMTASNARPSSGYRSDPIATPPISNVTKMSFRQCHDSSSVEDITKRISMNDRQTLLTKRHSSCEQMPDTAHPATDGRSSSLPRDNAMSLSAWPDNGIRAESSHRPGDASHASHADSISMLSNVSMESNESITDDRFPPQDLDRLHQAQMDQKRSSASSARSHAISSQPPQFPTVNSFGDARKSPQPAVRLSKDKKSASLNKAVNDGPNISKSPRVDVPTTKKASTDLSSSAEHSHSSSSKSSDFLVTPLPTEILSHDLLDGAIRSTGKVSCICSHSPGSSTMETQGLSNGEIVGKSYSLQDQSMTVEMAQAKGIPVIDNTNKDLVEQNGPNSSPKPDNLNIVTFTKPPVLTETQNKQPNELPEKGMTTSFSAIKQLRENIDNSGYILMQNNAELSDNADKDKTSLRAIFDAKKVNLNHAKVEGDISNQENKDSKPMVYDLTQIRLKLEEKRKMVEKEKLRMEVARCKQKQRLGKAMLLQQVGSNVGKACENRVAEIVSNAIQKSDTDGIGMKSLSTKIPKSDMTLSKISENVHTTSTADDTTQVPTTKEVTKSPQFSVSKDSPPSSGKTDIHQSPVKQTDATSQSMTRLDAVTTSIMTDAIAASASMTVTSFRTKDLQTTSAPNDVSDAATDQLDRPPTSNAGRRQFSRETIQTTIDKVRRNWFSDGVMQNLASLPVQDPDLESPSTENVVIAKDVDMSPEDAETYAEKQKATPSQDAEEELKSHVGSCHRDVIQVQKQEIGLGDYVVSPVDRMQFTSLLPSEVKQLHQHSKPSEVNRKTVAVSSEPSPVHHDIVTSMADYIARNTNQSNAPHGIAIQQSRRQPNELPARMSASPQYRDGKSALDEAMAIVSGTGTLASRTSSMVNSTDSPESYDEYNQKIDRLNNSLTELQGEIMRLSLKQGHSPAGQPQNALTTDHAYDLLQQQQIAYSQHGAPISRMIQPSSVASTYRLPSHQPPHQPPHQQPLPFYSAPYIMTSQPIPSVRASIPINYQHRPTTVPTFTDNITSPYSVPAAIQGQNQAINAVCKQSSANQNQDLQYIPEKVSFAKIENGEVSLMADVPVEGENEAPHGNEGFFVSFSESSPLKPKPKLGTKERTKKKSRETGGHNVASSPRSHKKQISQNLDNSLSPPMDVTQDSMHNQSVGYIVVDGDGTTDMTVDEDMVRKREQFMLQQLKRREEQEKKRIDKDMQQAERARALKEESDRRKDENRKRREAIFQKYIEKKSVEDEDHAIPKVQKRGSSVGRQRPQSMYVKPKMVEAARHEPNVTLDDLGAVQRGSRGDGGSHLDKSGSLRPTSKPSRIWRPVSCQVLTDQSQSMTFGAPPTSRRPPSPDVSSHGTKRGSRIYDSGSEGSSTSLEYTGPKLFVRPNQKSNRHIIINAISHVSLAGTVNADTKNKVLEEIAKSDAKHFMILFRDGGYQYRGLYTYIPEADDATRIQGVGPKVLTSEMVEKFYKYNSGSKSFTVIAANKHLSVMIDAVVVQNTTWQNKASSSKKPVTYR